MNVTTPDAKEIFFAALDKESPEDLSRYLDEACGGNAQLRERVEQLLRAHHQAGQFLSSEAAAEATLDQPPTEQVGAQIGPYKLLQQIGEGGMGVVYMAEQSEPVQRNVALKVIKPGMDSHQVIARFEAEKQALAMMDHVNIARVFDAGTTEQGRPYFVMELVHGVPITQYCDDNRLTPRQRLELFVPVCQAIQHAHTKGIIHRDIKPSNVMITLYDGKPVPKVIDFGVAKATEQKLTERTLFTQYGAMIGTLEYMSPEQAEMSALGVDTRSDIFSLGVLLYELLTGSTPLTHKRIKEGAYAEILRLIKEEEPQKPSTRLSESGEALASISAQRHMEPAKLSKLMRGELDWIVMKTLEKDRSRRYETASGFAKDIEHYLNDEPVLACPPSAAYRFRKFARRNKGKLALAFTAAVAVVLALVGLAVSNILITQEKDLKVAALQRAKLNEDAANKQKEIAEKNAVKAKEQERLAASNAQTAKANEKIAKANEQLARRRFYAAQMHLAMQAWESGEAHRVLALLESLRPKVDEDDLRTFEWYYLWRLCQGGLRHSFPMLQHDNGSAMALSPDGQTLAAGFGETIKLWDTRTGLEERSLTGHTTMVEAMAFTADGKTLVSSDTLTMRTWDIPSGKEGTVISTGRTSNGQAPFAITADGKTLVLGGPQLSLWDLSTGLQTGIVTSGADSFYIPAVSPDGQTIAARCGDVPYIVKIWTREGESWRERHAIQGHGWGFTAAFSPDGKTLAVSGGQVKCYEVATGQLRFALAGHGYAAWSVAYSGDGKTLITTAGDKTARIWDAATGRQVACLAHPQPVYGAALSADGKVAATASRVIRIWDASPPQDALVLTHAARVGTVAVSADGAILASSGVGDTRLWSLDRITGQSLQTTAERDPALAVSAIQVSLPGPAVSPARGPCLGLSRDGQTLAVPEPAAQNIGLWNAAGKKLAVLEGHDKPVIRLAMSPDGRRLASISESPEGILWDLEAHKPLSKFRIVGTLSSIAFSPDSKTLAVGSQFGAAKLFDAATGRELATLQRFELATDWTEALAFSPDSKLVAVCSQMGNVQVWEVASGRLHAAFSSHDSGGCCAFAFSPDSRTLATAGHDATVKFWDVVTGQERCTLKGHQGPIRSLVFTPDASFLITGSDDGTVRLWPATTDDQARARKTEFDIHAPLTPAALDEQGDNLWQYGHVEEAERAYAQSADRLEKLAASFPDSSELKQETIRNLLSRSLLLEETARPGQARPLRKEALERYRNLSASDQQLLIWAYRERGRKQSSTQNQCQAERTYSQLIELDPSNDQARSARRWIRFELGKWEGIVEDSSQLITRNPDVAYHWTWRGVAYSRLGQNEKALADYSRAIELTPGNADYWLNRGTCYDELGQRDKAIADLSQAIKLKPNHPFFHFRLGQALERAGKSDDSLQSYRQAIELSPKDPGLRSQLIQSLHRRRAALDERALSSLGERWERWKLATDYFQLAVALKYLEELTESEAIGRQSLHAFFTLAEEDPQETQFDYDIGWATHLIADILARRGLCDEALPLARQSFARFQALVEMYPDRPEYQSAIAVANGLLAHLFGQLNHPEESAQAQRAMASAQQATEELRKLPGVQQLLDTVRPHAQVRDWNRAAEALNKGFEQRHRSDASLCYAASLARLLSGDVDGYVQLAERMPIRRRGRWETLDVLRTCTLHPRGSADPAALVRLARSAYDSGVNNWSAQNLGLALYRAGKFDQALSRIEEARKLSDWYLFWPALAMCHHQLGHTDEARQWLDKSKEFFRQVTEADPEPLKVTKEPYWQDWAYFEVMLREANTLIDGKE